MTVLRAVESRTQDNDTNDYDYVGILPRYNATTSTNKAASKTSHLETNLHGNVNILLGGAMLCGLITVVILMCYCCHKNIRKSRPQEYSPYWRNEPDLHSLEVFTTESRATTCYERQSSTQVNQGQSLYEAISHPEVQSLGPAPPPTYDSLIFDPRSLPVHMDEKLNAHDSPENVIPSIVSTLLVLTTSPIQFAEYECTEEDTSTFDEGLPSYEAAVNLDANGYV